MRELSTDIAIIGAGPAGLSAAIQAANTGAHVLVIDENALPGGQLFKQIHKFFGSKEHKSGMRGFSIGQQLLDEVKASGAEVMLNAVAYGYFEDFELGVIQEGRHYRVKAKKIIFASGAKENYIAFPGSTLPGVMGAGAAQTMINVNRVLPGKRVLMVGSGNVGLIVSYQLMQAGADVVALVEAAPKLTGYGVHASKIRRAGVPIFASHTVKHICGEKEVEKAEIVALDEQGRMIEGSEKMLDVDTVCLAVGLNPLSELAWLAGCKFTFIPALGGHVPMHDENMETTAAGIYVAGDITGVEEASSAMEEGCLAGVCAAEAIGTLLPEAASKKKDDIRHRLDTLRTGMFGEKRKNAKIQQIQSMQLYKNSLSKL